MSVASVKLLQPNGHTFRVSILIKNFFLLSSFLYFSFFFFSVNDLVNLAMRDEKRSMFRFRWNRYLGGAIDVYKIVRL